MTDHPRARVARILALPDDTADPALYRAGLHALGLTKPDAGRRWHVPLRTLEDRTGGRRAINAEAWSLLALELEVAAGALAAR